MLREPEKMIQVVVPRSGDKLSCAVVTARVPQTFGDDCEASQSDTRLLLGAIQLAVTAWFRQSNRGRQVIEVANNFDFNLGDLAAEIGNHFTGQQQVECNQADLCWHLQQQDILSMNIDVYQSDDPHHGWEFDDKLYDELEVETQFPSRRSR